MSLQSEAVKWKVKHVGAVRCNICEGMRADCVQFRTGWFSSVTLCDTCAALVLREFDPDKKRRREIMPFIESIFWLALNLYHECRGEPLAGKIAVAHVCLNRAEKRGKSLREIILQPYQFSWANGGARPKITEYEALSECFDAAVQALGDRLEGKTFHHADHYHEVHMSPYPSWTKDMAKVATVGNHIFYRS